jgi:hypothetical protein
MRDSRAPQFMHDLFGDLRDRHLLPIVAVLLLGVAAMPFLLAAPAPKPESPEPSPDLATETNAGVDNVTVVSADTQVRDYRKRLPSREKNPFVQKFTGPQLKGSQLGESATTTVPSSSSGGADLPAPSASVTSSGGSGSSLPAAPGSTAVPGASGAVPATGGDDEAKVRTISYAVDVRIVRAGHRRTRRNARPLASLPSEKVPVVMYMGASRDGRKALFLVSDRVNSVFGDAKCLLGSDSCQLMQLEPGVPVTFLYGATDRRYRVKLLSIERVSGQGSPDRARKRH